MLSMSEGVEGKGEDQPQGGGKCGGEAQGGKGGEAPEGNNKGMAEVAGRGSGGSPRDRYIKCSEVGALVTDQSRLSRWPINSRQG